MATVRPYKDQDYESLVDQHSSTRLFSDPEFPACIHSISMTGKLELAYADGEQLLNLLEWRRPHVTSFLQMHIKLCPFCSFFRSFSIGLDS